MKLLLVGGPADGTIIDVADPRGPGDTIKWAARRDPRDVSIYTLVRWGFTGVGWLYIGVHESVTDDQEKSRLAVYGMLRPELLEALRRTP